MTEQIAFMMGHRYIRICGELVMYDEDVMAYMHGIQPWPIIWAGGAGWDFQA